MEDCWRVGDNPRSRLFSFALLISIFLLPRVEYFAVALCFFRSLLKKTAFTYFYLLSIPSCSLQNGTFWWLPYLQFFVQKVSCCFQVQKAIEIQIFKSSDVFSFVTMNFLLFSKAPFGQIVVQDLQTASKFDLVFKKLIIKIIPPNGCPFLTISPSHKHSSANSFGRYIIYFGFF